MEERILEKAGGMFLNIGFKSVTMDDIATELGMSKKTLYKYYSNKASLVSASVEAVHNKIEEMMQFVKKQKYNAVAEEFAIKAIFKEMLKNAKESPMYQLKKYYPETHEQLMQREKELFRECNLDNLQKGVAQGLYRENIDIERVMDFYFILIFGVYDNEVLKNTMPALLEIEYKALEYHIRAIATRKGVEELEKQISIINKNN